MRLPASPPTSRQAGLTEPGAAASTRLLHAFRAEELAGIRLATRARLAALAAAAVWVLLLEPPPGRYWYEGIIVILAVLGIAHQRVACRDDRPWVGYVFVSLDAFVLVYALLLVTAQLQPDLPPQMALRTAPVAYLFLLISYVALSYSPRLMLWAGVAGAAAWAAGVAWLASRPGAVATLAGDPTPESLLRLHLDPYFVDLRMRTEEAAILVVSAALLAFVVRRSRQLVGRQARAARERANLARYFSPRLVEELADRDEPLGPVRRQHVAVLFADMVGFTTLAESMAPEEVMSLLRGYHSRMEREVFEHNGTLEKFIGDALLATFGVPEQGPHDAADALACAFAMVEAIERWNVERMHSGELPIRIGIGVHYGPVVLGEIGSERNMAFAVVGDTVNTTSRLQALTRELNCRTVMSDALVQTLRQERTHLDTHGLPLVDGGLRRLRGREEPIGVWLVREPATSAAAAPPGTAAVPVPSA